MADLSKIVDELSSLTGPRGRRAVRSCLRRKWGVSAAALLPLRLLRLLLLPPGEEQTEFNVILTKPARKDQCESRRSGRSPDSASRRPRISSKARPSRQGWRVEGRGRQIRKQLEEAGAKVDVK